MGASSCQEIATKLNRRSIAVADFGDSFPLYWPLLQPASPMEIVSHRAVWSLFFCLVALGIAKQLKSTYALLKNPKVFFRLLLAAGLISVNWLVYIWGVNNEHVVETALGYYINPLIIIAFGVIMLREKMRKLQWVAVSFGALGVIVLTIDFFILDKDRKVVYSRRKRSEGLFNFNATKEGEYMFVFSNLKVYHHAF